MICKSNLLYYFEKYGVCSFVSYSVSGKLNTNLRVFAFGEATVLYICYRTLSESVQVYIVQW